MAFFIFHFLQVFIKQRMWSASTWLWCAFSIRRKDQAFYL